MPQSTHGSQGIASVVNTCLPSGLRHQTLQTSRPSYFQKSSSLLPSSYQNPGPAGCAAVAVFMQMLGIQTQGLLTPA